MPFRHVVVDGSNLATEGRSHPSLEQLDGAIEEFRREYPKAKITVVVDASFGHRIDPSERPRFEKDELAGRLVSPPAGAIGRGDAFLLRIAEKTGAAVLSNDSFQEFHGEHDWLFSENRLIGGKPVPGVGWIFTPRTPVRGARSRAATGAAKRATRAKTSEATVRKAIDEAKEEAVEPEATVGRRKRRRGGPPPQAVNDPLTFITFIAGYSLGDTLEGEVESFTSHGAFVKVDGCRCYVPLSGLGDPAPRSARSVLSKGQRRTFVLQALDPPRRGVELALPGVARVSGTPSDETVEAEISGATTGPRKAAARVPPGKRVTKKTPAKKGAPVKGPATGTPEKKTAAKKAATAKKAGSAAKKSVLKTAGRKQPPAKKTAAGKGTQTKRGRAPSKAPTKKGSTPTKESAPRGARLSKTQGGTRGTPAASRGRSSPRSRGQR